MHVNVKTVTSRHDVG